MYSPLDIKGECALITGATAGIGEACAWRFAEAGCKLVLVGRRAERLEALKVALEAKFPGAVHKCVQLDVCELDKVAALPAELKAAGYEVDILVNNAGLALGTSTADANVVADVQTMMATNVTSLMAMTSAFVPGMKERSRGHLINIGSIAGHESYGGGSVYCATKHAVTAFTTAARHDLVATPVRVTCISPGMVNTEFSTVRFGGSKEQADKVYENIEPLVGADIADQVIYAATRPRHVQVADIVCFCTNQSAAKSVARVGPSLGAA